jgi:arabinose-5-phosphate isomerase
VADVTLAAAVLRTEASAILALVERLDARFDRAVELLRACRGRVILTGIGKSGIICQKIAATLSSTGTPAHFLHPTEAIHGDLGVVQGDDVVVALSYGGETKEILQLLEAIRRLGAKLIVLTGDPASTLAQAADVALDCSVTAEACPLNLVPTASTTAALALGDALAMTLLVEKGFRQEDFANLHPGGRLGKRFLRVDAVMHSGQQCPLVREDTRMRDVIYEMTSKALGMTCVADRDSRLVGIITDGDLRRHMDRSPGILELTAADIMTREPISVQPDTLAADALNVMEQRKITSLVVLERGGRIGGVVHLHDLWGEPR